MNKKKLITISASLLMMTGCTAKKVNVSDSLSAYKNYTADISVTETKQTVMQISYLSGNQNCGEVIFRTMPDSPSDMVVVYDEKNAKIYPSAVFDGFFIKGSHEGGTDTSSVLRLDKAMIEAADIVLSEEKTVQEKSGEIETVKVEDITEKEKVYSILSAGTIYENIKAKKIGFTYTKENNVPQKITFEILTEDGKQLSYDLFLHYFDQTFTVLGCAYGS